MTFEALRHAKAIVALLFGPPHERSFDVRYWDDSRESSGAVAPFTFVIRRRGSLRRMLFPPTELTIIEAFLSGDVDIEGDIEHAMTIGDEINRRLRSPGNLVALARHLGALPKEDAEIEVRSARAEHSVEKVGDAHEPERDKAAIRYHYDVGNDFYALWLDERMVYSCAYFERGADVEAELADAQRAKLDMVCRKLQLQPGERLLDVGCGWGALIMHAVEHYGVHAFGITLSENQASFARARIEQAGFSDRCRVEIRDYRALHGEPSFDKISSIGMVEHVGESHLAEYFNALYGALAPGGLLLNHGIVSVGAARPTSRLNWLERRLWKRNAFMEQYVFPDGRLVPLSIVIASAERAGFETRDVHGLREHYVFTLRAWLARLMRNSTAAIGQTDERTFRTWRLYMAGAAYGFASGRLNIVQALLSKADENGRSHLPLRREM